MIVRTAAEMRAVVDGNPLTIGDPAKTAVLFLYATPAPLDGFDAGAYAPEEMAVVGREVYFGLPNGIGRAKLPPAAGRRLKVPATMRNWRSVTALLDLAGG